MRANPKRKLVYGTDAEYGVQGLRPAEHGGFNYLDGMGVAHDLLEHFPNDPGDIAGEFEALGAMIFVRGTDYFYRKRGGSANQTVEANLSSDLPNLYGYWKSGQFNQGRLFDTPPKAPAPDDFDEKEFIKECESLSKHDVDDAEEFMTLCRAAIPWIRYGYKRAAKRYQRFGHEHMVELFIAIEEAVNKAINELKNYGGNDIPVSVSYDINRMSVDVWISEGGRRYELT